MFRVLLALAVLFAGSTPLATGQDDKKGPPPDPKPKISMALPLNVLPGSTTKVTLRGLNLDQATEVRFSEPLEGGSVSIKGKGKAEIPKETDPAVYGDTKVDLEVKLPAEVSAEKVLLVGFKNPKLKPLTGKTLAAVAASRSLSRYWAKPGDSTCVCTPASSISEILFPTASSVSRKELSTVPARGPALVSAAARAPPCSFTYCMYCGMCM